MRVLVSLGWRVGQVAGILRRDIDATARTLRVRVGKSEAEAAEQRVVPLPAWLVNALSARLGATAPDDRLFYISALKRGMRRASQSAITAGVLSASALMPSHREYGRTWHAFRAAYMAHLQGLTVDVDGAEVRRVPDAVIDYLVGHHASTVRGRHYAAPGWRSLVAAVGLVEQPIEPVDSTARGANVVDLLGRR